MTWNLQQSMAMLAFSADIGLTSLSGKADVDEATLYGQLQTATADINSNAGTNWSVVWGPYIKTEPYIQWASNFPGLKYRIVNAMYVAQDGNNFVIGIAGTDFRSAYDWLIEDMDVWLPIEWSSVASKTKAPAGSRVSRASKNGLDDLLAGVPVAPNVPGTGTNITTFLAKNVPTGSTIYTTGHSLGGALSAVMALWIYDMQPAGSGITVLPYSYAGPTAGNDTLATYFDSHLSIQRVWNQVDVVPNAWATTSMNTFLQASKNGPAPPTTAQQIIISAAIKTTSGAKYTQPAGNGIELANNFNPQYTTFFCQLYYQHIIAYYLLLGLPVPSSAVMPASCSSS
jgi:hypothetical protein